MIPQGFIQDLLARIDIVDVVGRYVELKRSGQNYSGLCPFHGEKTASFTVSPSKQFFHCFGCGAHGSAIGFLIDHRGLNYVEAIRELAQQAGLTVPESAPNNPQIAAHAKGLTDLLQQAADYYRRQLKGSEAASYLKGRGLTGETAVRFALGFSPDQWQNLRAIADPAYEDPRWVDAGLVIVGDEGKRYDRFRGRVMFPIRNQRGLVIGFGARVMGVGEPKYLNSPETAIFHKGQELYGLFEARDSIRLKRRAIVCEGYMDVIQLAQAGFSETVAALGTAVTAQHVSTLFRLTDHVIFAFDGDAAGRKAARRALEAALPLLADTKRASFVLLPQGEDPDSLIRAQGASAFEDELSRAWPLSRWFIAVLTEDKDLQQAEGRAAVLAESRPFIESMPPSALRLQLLRELSTVTRSAPEEIEQLFGLKRWRRLPTETPSTKAKRAAPVEDVKTHILQQLVAYPKLAREFNAQIAEECLGSDTLLDRQIVELWRVATAASDLSSGALLESLAGSEFAPHFQTLVTAGMALSDDIEPAREDIASAFQVLELRRVETELGRLVQGPLNDDAKQRIRELSDRRAFLKQIGRGVSV